MVKPRLCTRNLFRDLTDYNLGACLSAMPKAGKGQAGSSDSYRKSTCLNDSKLEATVNF